MNTDPCPAESPRLLLLGPPRLFADGQWIPFAAERRFQLLAMLALSAGEWFPRDRIAGLLWPERDGADARRNLRKVIFRAHEVPGAGQIEATDHALRWQVTTDLQQFGQALHERRLGDAVALYRGPLLAGIDDASNAEFSQWLLGERARCSALWRQAALEQLNLLDDPRARIALAQRLLDDDALDESALAALIAAELALGRSADARRHYQAYAARLAEELGVEPSNAVRALLREPVPAAAADPGTPAPPNPAAFVGRRHELAELCALLARADCRLLTVLGPGGIGKSRLAREALGRVAREFPGGVHWIELQDLGDRAAVIARIALALGVDIDDRGNPVDALLHALSAQPVLLVLDNAEHLPDLPALTECLAGAPAPTKLLLTSRTRLNAAHEWVLPLAGLALPDEQSRDLEAAAAFDAVRLFCERARVARRDFDLVPHLDAVIGIVDAVQGMPLAIEMAASWVRLLPPAEIARDLQSSIDVLAHDPGGSATPARTEHASLRTVLDRSWDLLAPRERQALADLSVFRGGFTRSAAQAVAGASLPVLAALADKSLLTVDPAGRFGMHPMVALFAAERLATDPARAQELTNRHAGHFARAFADLAPHARGDQRLLARAVDAEYANGLRAWQHALAAQRFDWIGGMVPTWRCFHENRGRLVEGIAQLRGALALPERDAAAAAALARVRHALSSLLYRAGDLPQSMAIAQAALPAAQATGEREALKGCLGNLGLCLWNTGSAAEALAPFERALALCEEDGDRYGMATALSHVAIARKALGEFAQALALTQRALDIEREIGNSRGVATKLNNVGNLHRALSQWADARRYFEEGLRWCREQELAFATPYLELNLGLTLTELGELDAASRHLQRALDETHAAGQVQGELAAELGLARLSILRGGPQAAAALPRLQRVIEVSQARAFNTHPVQAAAIYGEWLAARGDACVAARVWLMVVRHPTLDEQDRIGTAQLLEALPLDAAQRQQAEADAPPLAAVLQDIAQAAAEHARH